MKYPCLAQRCSPIYRTINLVHLPKGGWQFVCGVKTVISKRTRVLALSAENPQLRTFPLKSTGAAIVRPRSFRLRSKQIWVSARCVNGIQSTCQPTCGLYSLKNASCLRFCWGKSPMSTEKCPFGQQTADITSMGNPFRFPVGLSKKQIRTQLQKSCIKKKRTIHMHFLTLILQPSLPPTSIVCII